MNKLLLLTRILRKVGSGQDNESEKKYAGDARLVLSVLFGVALAVGLYFAGGWFAGLTDFFGGVGAIFRLLFFVISVAVFFLSILDLVGTLYMSTDLPAILSLPFTPDQVVIARILNTSRATVLLGSAAILPFGVGFGLKSSVSPMYWVGLILGNLCIPLCAVLLAAALIILVMALFRFFRSRDTVKIIGALFALAIAILFSVVINTNKVDGEQAKEAVNSVIGTFSSLSRVIPSIPLTGDLMEGGSPLLIPAIPAITVGFALIFILISKKLYLRGALAMQDTSAGHGKLKEGGLSRASEKKSVREAYIRRELRTIFRTPAYLTNGWLMVFLWPVLMLIGFIGGADTGNMFSTLLSDQATESTLVGPCMALGMLAAVAPSCLSCLSVSVLNREGRSFYYMKMLPVPYAVQLRAKRDAVVRIVAVGSVGYVTLLMIAGIITGFVSVPLALYTLVLAAATLAVITNVQVLHGLKRPNLNWESETTVAKSNTFNIILFFVLFIVLFALMMLSPFLLVLLAALLNMELPLVSWLVAALILILMVIAGILLDRRVGTVAERKLSQL